MFDERVYWVRQLTVHPQRTLVTDRVGMTSWNGRSGIVTGSTAGIIMSSLGKRGSNGLQLGKKRAQRHIHDRAYSGTWIVSAGESAAAACSGTVGWAGARLESANGSSWTLIALQFHTPFAHSKCRELTQQGHPDGTYDWNCSRYKYSRGVPACVAETNCDSLSCSATQPVRWVHHTTTTTQAYE